MTLLAVLVACGEGADPAEGALPGEDAGATIDARAPADPADDLDAGAAADAGGDADAGDDAGDAGDAGDPDALNHVCPTAPLARQTRANIFYQVAMYSGSQVKNVDLTSYDDIFGRTSASSAGPISEIRPWPGWSGTAPIFDRLKTDAYIAARFRVPADFPTDRYGGFHRFETLPSDITISISRKCGDFSPPEPRCVNSGDSFASSLVQWKMRDAPGVGCPLEPGKDYYVNIKSVPYPANTLHCNQAGCRVAVLLYL